MTVRNFKKPRSPDIHTLISEHTQVQGDVHFHGGLHVDGAIKGNVIADDSTGSVLTLSEQGTIEGEVRVPHIILNGTVIGDVYATERVEMANKARVNGNVYYNLIEMAIGAEINGNLVHEAAEEAVLALPRAEDGQPAERRQKAASNS